MRTLMQNLRVIILVEKTQQINNRLTTKSKSKMKPVPVPWRFLPETNKFNP